MLTATAGTYRLCWCASGLPCDFGVDAGALTLLGPTWPVPSALFLSILVHFFSLFIVCTVTFFSFQMVFSLRDSSSGKKEKGLLYRGRCVALTAGTGGEVARTCVAGQTCSFHLSAPAAATMLLLDTCGFPPPPGLPTEQATLPFFSTAS